MDGDDAVDALGHADGGEGFGVLADDSGQGHDALGYLDAEAFRVGPHGAGRDAFWLTAVTSVVITSWTVILMAIT